MYKLFGLINVILVILLTASYWVPRLNKHLLHLKSPAYYSFVRLLRRIHKPMGLALLLSAAVHGFLAPGGLRLHTGSVLFVIVFVTSLLGGSFFRLKKPELLKGHRLAALLVVLFLLLHLLFPNAFSGLR